MTPFLQACEVYEREPCARTLAEDMWHHLEHGGYVFSTPRFFIMGRPVFKDWPMEKLLSPWEVAHEHSADCWWIWLAAGHWTEAIPLIPSPKKWLAWERRGSPRFWTLNQLLKRCSTISPTTTAAPFLISPPQAD